MANAARRLKGNTPGPFFVDETCIDCDLCRQIAPEVYVADDGQSVVGRQPETSDSVRRAAMALVACPTASIGSSDPVSSRLAAREFPERIDEDVYFCGYASEKSYGAKSYFIVRRAGNVLVDSPRYAGVLARAFDELGGVRTMFLTHRDDVADHARFRRRFDCERIIHVEDSRGIEAERLLSGDEPQSLGDDLLAIPTPGHTKGHAVLLYRDRFLFTGDHLAWSDRYGHLIAFPNHNWYSWTATIRSMERLREYRFEWVLPGHGRPVRLTGPSSPEIDRCVDWMRSVR